MESLRDVTNTKLQGAIGWEGDIDAPIVYVDGSYKLRGNDDTVIAFYEYELDKGAVEWNCSEGYLPCWTSKFTASDILWQISNFADKVIVNGNDYEVMYTRVILENKSNTGINIPVFNQKLIRLNKPLINVLPSGESVTMDFCVGADRFGNNYAWPTCDELAGAGGFDLHYIHMKNYWNNRLKEIVSIDKLPKRYSDLINAYKAGYIYTLIISDGYELHVGENGYDRVFDHDAIGILVTLLELGHTENFAEYSKSILKNIQYPDAAWKFSWPFAMYLLKTEDYETVLKFWNDNNGNAGIKTNTHKIAEEREIFDEAVFDKTGRVARIMKKTDAIDSFGFWAVDNYSSLFGLTAYSYLCECLYNKFEAVEYKAELEWAQSEYIDLLYSTEAVFKHTMEKYNLCYLPYNMEIPNEQNKNVSYLDANSASAFEFGRWDWNAILFGGEKKSLMTDKTDDTYEQLIKVKKDVLPSPYTMGGYPGVSSGYNAGYYEAALAGEKYRTYGIQAYLWLIENGMSCPYGTWECIKNSTNESVWNKTCCTDGWGSCQHMWGQSMNTKVLLDSMIAEKTDGTLIIGRGFPFDFNKNGEEITVSNFLCEAGKRIGFTIKTENNTVVFNLLGDRLEKTKVRLELPVFVENIVSVSSGSFNYEKGIVVLEVGLRKSVIKIKSN